MLGGHDSHTHKGGMRIAGRRCSCVRSPRDVKCYGSFIQTGAYRPASITGDLELVARLSVVDAKCTESLNRKRSLQVGLMPLWRLRCRWKKQGGKKNGGCTRKARNSVHFREKVGDKENSRWELNHSPPRRPATEEVAQRREVAQCYMALGVLRGCC